MYFSKQDILNTSRIKRLNLINSITGIKPGNLIGTISEDGHSNLAIFSSVIHLGSNPALIGFITRPDKLVKRDTLENILETNYYTINHIHQDFIEQSHKTSESTRKMYLNSICGILLRLLFDFLLLFSKKVKLKWV